MNPITRYPAKALSLRGYFSSLSLFLSLTFTFVLCFSFSHGVVHYISFFRSHILSPFLLEEDSTASIFHKSKRKARKKVSNDDNTQFDKTDKGLN